MDEEHNRDDLKFYWKGIAYDNHFDFVDRLQNLYRTGMDEFLKEDVTYISNEEIDSAFWAIRGDENAIKETIQDYFRQLKFFSNNAFSLINVHNEELFNQKYKSAYRACSDVARFKAQGVESQTNFWGICLEGIF